MSTRPYAWISSLLLGVSLGLTGTVCTDDGAVETDASHLTGRVASEGAATGGVTIEAYALDVRGTVAAAISAQLTAGMNEVGARATLQVLAELEIATQSLSRIPEGNLRRLCIL